MALHLYAKNNIDMLRFKKNIKIRITFVFLPSEKLGTHSIILDIFKVPNYLKT